MSRAVRTLAVHATLVALALLTLAPLLWMVSASLMSSGEANTFPPQLLPRQPGWQQYRILFERLRLGAALFNSAFLAAAITALSLLINSMAGYAFAKLPFRGRAPLYRWMLAALLIPGQLGTLPLFLMLKQIGAINSYWGVIIPGMASIFGIFLIRQYMLSIPDSILDAARVDGASEARIYWSLVLPASRPILVTLAMFTFVGAWNDFLWPLVVLTSDELYTLPVALANLTGEHALDTELTMAGSVVTIAPVAVLFIALQRYYVAGILGGSVKE